MSKLGWRIAAAFGLGMFAYEGLLRFRKTTKPVRSQLVRVLDDEVYSRLPVREAASGCCEAYDEPAERAA